MTVVRQLYFFIFFHFYIPFFFFYVVELEERKAALEVSKDDATPTSRKSNSAGRHLDHHCKTATKLSSAERLRIISSEAHRKDTVKAVERKWRLRHRLSRNNRTLYERFRGMNSQRKPFTISSNETHI